MRQQLAIRFHSGPAGVPEERLELETTVPIPDHPKPGHVTLKVSYTGVCGTDLKVMRGEVDSEDRIILGHEFGGEVWKVGEGVTSVRPGDKVSVNPESSCGSCEFCERGKPNYCVSGGLRSTLGLHRDGGMAQYCEVPAAQVYKAPEGMTAQLAVLCEPVSCVLHGYKKFGEIPNDAEILVLGAGFCGILWASVLRYYGYRHVTISELAEGRKDRAKSLGFKVCTFGELQSKFNPGNPDALDAAVDGYDIIIECTGSPTAMHAIEFMRRGGKLNVFGRHPNHSELPIRPVDIVQKELTIFGTLINPFTFHEAGKLVVNMKDQLTYERLGVTVFELSEYKKAISDLQSGQIVKAVLKIGNDW